MPLKESRILKVAWWSSVGALPAAWHTEETVHEIRPGARSVGPAGAPTPTDMQPQMSEERTVLLQGVSPRARPGWQGLHSSREQREVPAAVREPARLALTQTGPGETGPGRAAAARLWPQTPPLRWATPPTHWPRHFPLSLRQSIKRDHVKKKKHTGG